MVWCFGLNAWAQKEPITVPYILAIGDLHADLNAAKAIFKLAGLIDEQAHWIPQKGHVVQTGDVTDRGPDGLQLLEWLKRLEAESNGQLTILLGNHEIMNLMGDWRYVSSSDLESFGGKSKRIEAFQPGGEWRNWLLQHHSVALIDGTLFVHGGIHPDYAMLGIDQMNSDIELAIQSRTFNAAILGSNGPLWYRDYIQAPESVACPQLATALAALGAKRMVVGHTTQRNGKIQARCNNQVIVIDTGISAHYGGHLSFLRI